MRRRRLLQRVGAAGSLGVLALAGCQGPTNGPSAGGSNGNDDGSGGSDGGGSPTDQSTASPAWDPPVTDVRLRTLDGECASGDGPTAHVSFDGEDGTVRIDGTATAPTPCHQVTVESVAVDEGGDDGSRDQLTVELGTEPEDQGGCVECVGALTFEATIEIDGDLPSTVVVRQADARLARVDRGEGDGTPGDGITIADSTFEVVGRTNVSGDPSAEVTFHDDANEVTVTGTIHGSDGCKTAALENVSYDADADRVAVSIATEDRAGTEDQMCTQAIVAIDYEAGVTFEGGTPASASVVHDGHEVTRAGHGSASASPPPTTGDDDGTTDTGNETDDGATTDTSR